MPLSEADKVEVIPMLGKTPIFSSLDKKRLNSIAKASTKRVFKEGETIAKQGDSAVAFYLILTGAVEVRRGKKVLSKLGRGQFFGEMALFDEQPRSADVVAVEETTCLLLTSWAFEGLLADHREVAKSLTRELVRRLRETDMALSE